MDSKKYSIDVDGVSAYPTRVSARGRIKNPQSSMDLELRCILRYSKSLGEIDYLGSSLFSCRRSEFLLWFTTGGCSSWCSGCFSEQSWIELSPARVGLATSVGVGASDINGVYLFQVVSHVIRVVEQACLRTYKDSGTYLKSYL
ncbi:hypothetical protein KY289_013475 [Solanum tuberosum]|nr:hypothetical protein KY289_013475 [Solanum tuberosum]